MPNYTSYLTSGGAFGRRPVNTRYPNMQGYGDDMRYPAGYQQPVAAPAPQLTPSYGQPVAYQAPPTYNTTPQNTFANQAGSGSTIGYNPLATGSYADINQFGNYTPNPTAAQTAAGITNPKPPIVPGGQWFYDGSNWVFKPDLAPGYRPPNIWETGPQVADYQAYASHPNNQINPLTGKPIDFSKFPTYRPRPWAFR